jgi:hypothetical protein
MFCFASPDSKDRKMSKTQEKLLKLSQGQGPGHEVSQDSGLVSGENIDKGFTSCCSVIFTVNFFKTYFGM